MRAILSHLLPSHRGLGIPTQVILDQDLTDSIRLSPFKEKVFFGRTVQIIVSRHFLRAMAFGLRLLDSPHGPGTGGAWACEPDLVLGFHE